MTTTDTDDLGQTYTQTANIDMSGYTSTSIATAEDFTGSYDGNGYTITIRSVDANYTGLFSEVSKAPALASPIIININLIYQSIVNLSVGSRFPTDNVWGGLAGAMTVSSVENCSVTYNGTLTITTDRDDTDCGAVFGFMGQNCSVTGCQLIINNTITFNGVNRCTVGLLCGEIDNSSIRNSSITTSSGNFSIDIKAVDSPNSNLGFICGTCSDSFTDLNSAILDNITVNFNNTGIVILDRISPVGSTINKGILCGSSLGDPGSPNIQITNCTININNNQTLIGDFSIFVGNIDPSDKTTITACQLNYTTTTDNTSIPLTISPTPSAAPVIYTNSYTNIYSLASGGTYYIPNTSGSLILGTQLITLQSQSPQGILINGILQAVGTTFTSQTNQYGYTILIKGVGSMYFGFNYTGLPNIIDTPIECICQVNSCSTNPQTGISSDSRITNMREDKTIRVNVDREFMRNSVIAPKFNSYRDYMKYLQAGLKY